MNNWKTYTLAAVLVTVAGFAYVNNSRRNTPSDLRDAVSEEQDGRKWKVVDTRSSDIENDSKAYKIDLKFKSRMIDRYPVAVGILEVMKPFMEFQGRVALAEGHSWTWWSPLEFDYVMHTAGTLFIEGELRVVTDKPQFEVVFNDSEFARKYGLGRYASCDLAETVVSALVSKTNVIIYHTSCHNDGMGLTVTFKQTETVASQQVE